MSKAGQPWFVLVGGINGAGKSTFAQNRWAIRELVVDLGEPFEIINPDLVTRRLLEEAPGLPVDEANRRAATECEARVRAFIAEGKQSFAIETVLSTDKYRPIVEQALRAGFGVLFVYVLLGSVEEAIGRVRRRVSEGGHDVPEQKIRKRWPRSLANLKWFWEHSTQAYLFFNGSRVDEPFLVAARSDGAVSFDVDSIAYLLA